MILSVVPLSSHLFGQWQKSKILTKKKTIKNINMKKQSLIMKKIILILIIGILLCFSCENAMAQAPYKASIGGVHTITGIGPSFKAFVADNVTIQTDLLFRASFPIYKEKNDVSLGLIVLIEQNTNIMYQKKFKDKPKSELFWFIGGGVSLGYQVFVGNAKFGVNAISGFEWIFKKIPLAIQLDLRPGYGMLFHSGENLNSSWFISDTNPLHHFDWMIGFTIRRTFNKKGIE